jgi:hypothetical protein
VEQEQEEVEQEQEKEEVEQEQEQEQARAQPTGSWRRRRSDNPKITCSDEAVTIIAELASAHCQSSMILYLGCKISPIMCKPRAWTMNH